MRKLFRLLACTVLHVSLTTSLLVAGGGCEINRVSQVEDEDLPKDEREARSWLRDRQQDAQERHYEDRMIDRWDR
jgi:hypothetical protein